MIATLARQQRKPPPLTSAIGSNPESSVRESPHRREQHGDVPVRVRQVTTSRQAGAGRQVREHRFALRALQDCSAKAVAGQHRGACPVGFCTASLPFAIFGISFMDTSLMVERCFSCFLQLKSCSFASLRWWLRLHRQRPPHIRPGRGHPYPAPLPPVWATCRRVALLDDLLAHALPSFSTLRLMVDSMHPQRLADVLQVPLVKKNMLRGCNGLLRASSPHTVRGGFKLCSGRLPLLPAPVMRTAH